MEYKVTYYPDFEEKINILSHGLGAVLSVVALPFLINKASKTEDNTVVLSIAIYGVSMVVLYLASTLYHSAIDKKFRYYLNIFDHSAIYVLIAGTYAPVALIVLQGSLGWLVFGLSWGFAFLGILFKIFFIGRFRVASIVMYVAMGWMLVFAFKPLLQNFSVIGLKMFALGGVSYSIGALFYGLKKVPYNHAIFHLFVLIGSLFHFIAIYSHVL
jgi:hemolysin III